MINRPEFYDADAVLKYNVCPEGLYLNDEYGLNQNSSPYLGIYKTNNKWIGSITITQDIHQQIITDYEISKYIKSGLIPNSIKRLDAKIRVYMSRNQRDAAYVAQYIRFNEYKFDTYKQFILDFYVHNKIDINTIWENIGNIPQWKTIEINTKTYDPDAIEWKINKDIIKKAQTDKEKRLKKIEQQKIIESNKQRLRLKAIRELANKLGINKQQLKININDYMIWDKIPRLQKLNSFQLAAIKTANETLQNCS